MNAVVTLPKGWVQVPHLNAVWDVCVQAHTDSCAIACIAMAVNRVDGSHPTERAVMTAVSSGGRSIRPNRGYQPSDQDFVNKQDPLYRGYNDTRETRGQTVAGTFADSIPSYLAAYRIVSAYKAVDKYSGLGGWLTEATKYPLIAKVRSQSRLGKHFILIDSLRTPESQAGFMSECEWVIKDPATENRVGIGKTVPYCAFDHGLRTTYSTGTRVLWHIEEVVIVGRSGAIPF